MKKNKKFSKEHRKKISQNLKDQWAQGKRISGMLGKKHSDESKSKVSKKMMGNKNCVGLKQTKEHIEKRAILRRGKKGNRLGSKHSIETRKQMSESHKKERAYNYKGDESSNKQRANCSMEYRLWREKVFKRDNWTCQKCKKRGIELHPHHIYNFFKYIDLRFVMDNGITLCKDCHIFFHNKYGRINNNRKQLNNFLYGN